MLQIFVAIVSILFFAALFSLLSLVRTLQFRADVASERLKIASERISLLEDRTKTLESYNEYHHSGIRQSLLDELLSPL
jgi:hypothetical protein